jgi:hypothetical protein
MEKFHFKENRMTFQIHLMILPGEENYSVCVYKFGVEQ